MQPYPPPPAPVPASEILRSRSGLLLVVAALFLIAVAGVGGYLLGASGIGHATLRVQVTNNMNSNAAVQVTVNGALAGTLSVPSGQVATVDVPVAFATANGAAFDVEASTTAGLHDSTTVFVNTPGTFVVSLRLG